MGLNKVFPANYRIKCSAQQHIHKEQECCLFNECEQGYISLRSTQRYCTILLNLTVASISVKSQLLFIDKRKHHLKANN